MSESPLADVLPGAKIFEMPPIPREAFDSEEDYQRAVRTSESHDRDYGAEGSIMFIPAESLVDVVHALYSQASAVGMGVLHDKNPLTLDQIEQVMVEMQDSKWFDGRFYFDYLAGRPIKIGFDDIGDGRYKTETRLYNRDQGRAEQIISAVLTR